MIIKYTMWEPLTQPPCVYPVQVEEELKLCLVSVLLFPQKSSQDIFGMQSA